MPNNPFTRQPELFAEEDAAGQTVHTSVSEDFLARIRAELVETLSLVERGSALPWSDPTKGLLAELRFHSIANWLPADEASALCARFDAALDRLYAAMDNN